MKRPGALRRKAERVLELVRKEFRQVRRDPRLFRVLLVAPIMQLLAFGYAVSTDIRNTATFVVDHDQSRASRELVAAFTASGYFRVVGTGDRPAELVSALDRGEATVGLEIPPGYARDLDAGSAEVQILLDGTNSNLATVARGYAERIVASYGARLAGRAPAVDLRTRAWYNPDLRSQDYNVPAVIGAIVLLVCLLVTSLAIVREREIGTLDQLLVSPLTAGELILGKTIPFAIIGLVDLALVSAIALLWFGVPFKGSVVVLFLGSVLFLLSALGLGLLISSVSRTQQEAFMGAFLVYMPTMLLSGFMFPVSSMPTFFRWLTFANPLRHYLEIVRGVFLKGTGFAELDVQFAALAVMGVGILWLAAWRFRRSTA